MRLAILGLACLLWMAAVTDAAAAPAGVDGFHPTSGAGGDLVYVQGRGLGGSPTVSFNGHPAAIVRASPEALLCRVPAGLAVGPAWVTVGEERLHERFLVLADGGPVIHGISATVATPGQVMLLHGRRLGGGQVDFLHAHDGGGGSARALGGQRVVTIRVPLGLVAGRYRLRLTNARGLNTPPSSPVVDVRVPGPRLVFTVRGGTVRPGQCVTYRGVNVGPLGTCGVLFARGDEGVAAVPGWSNGYDAITVVVPYALGVDDWHQVRIAVPGEDARAVSRVFALPATSSPRLTLDSETASSGGTLGVQGMPASGLGGWPRVVLTRHDVRVQARTLYFHPGGLGHGRAWVVRLPDELEPAAYAVSVEVGERAFAVGSVRVQAP